MNSDYYCQSPLLIMKAASAFLVSVVVCTVFLINTQKFADSYPIPKVLIVEPYLMPLPDPPPSLPVSVAFSPEPPCVSPEMQWALTDARCLDTAPVIPDNLSRQQKIPFKGIIVQVAGRYQVDPHLIQAIIFAESGYNPRAKSKKGARGLMQLMPSTAKALGVEDIYDPVQNIDGGVRYFKSLLDRFEGDVQLALAAYNAGSRHVRNYEGVPPFKATQRYISKVLKFHKKFKMETASISRRLALGV